MQRRAITIARRGWFPLQNRASTSTARIPGRIKLSAAGTAFLASGAACFSAVLRVRSRRSETMLPRALCARAVCCGVLTAPVTPIHKKGHEPALAKGSKHERIEEGKELDLDFGKLRRVVNASSSEVVPCAVQDYDTGELLIVAFVNQEALDYTLKTKMATFWSTSRNKLWIKGATSGDYLKIVDIRVNCEQNSLLFMVRPQGSGACHTKSKETGASRPTCYYRSLLASPEDGLDFLHK